VKILHVLEAVEGGTALHVRHLAGQQVKDHAVAVAVPVQRSWGKTDDQFVADLEPRGVDVWSVGMRRNPAHPVNARAVATMIRRGRAWRPDVVHAHSTVGGLLGRVVGAALRVPVVHTQNGATFATVERGPSAMAGRALEWLGRPFTKAEIAVSDSEADALRSVHPASRVVVIANGIPWSGASPAPLPECPTVVAVCRFVHQKDPLQVVRVMAGARRSVAGARALIVGYGELEPDVRALIAELDPGIEITANIPGPEAMATATVVLLCSRFEGAPYVLLEAMERSRPVVATDVVGSRNAIVEGANGFLFPYADVAAGAAAVARLLRDVELAKRMGTEGRRLLLERFTVDQMAAKVEGVYERVIAHQPLHEGATP